MKKLYKSRKDKMLCGVCGGLAKYLGIDPTLIRLGLMLLVVLAGTGLLAYILAALIIPMEPEEFDSYYSEQQNAEAPRYGHRDN